MRRPRPILLAFAALLLAGCGDRNLVLKVDVLSYMDPNLTRVDFGPIPAVPGGLHAGEREIVKDVDVNLLEGANSFTEVRNVSIAMGAIADAATGSGTDTLRLYVSDADVDPLTTPPVLALPLVFAAGAPDTARAVADADARVGRLFAGKRLRITLTSSLRGPESGDDLNATLELSGLDAVLVAGRKAGL